MREREKKEEWKMKQNQKARKKYTRPHRAGKKPADRQNFEKEILRVLQRAGNRGASAKYLQEQAGVPSDRKLFVDTGGYGEKRRGSAEKGPIL